MAENKAPQNIDNKHASYDTWKIIWKRTRDGIAGQEKIKSEGKTYLPQLGGQSTDSYNAYLQRSQYTNYSGKTLDVALGQLFRKLPIIAGIEDENINNISLTGQSAYYFAKDTAAEMMTVNRVGIMVDYSVDQERTYLTQYNAEQIINWDETIIDGVKKLSLVVLEGQINVSKNIFVPDLKTAWRVLQIEDGKFVVRDYIKTGTANDKSFTMQNEFIPLKDGSPLEFIPFYFFTVDGISTKIKKSPLADFVNVNLGHYKNSADLENMLHLTGAKTVVTKGWPKGVPVPIGGSFDVGDNGDAFYLEAKSDSGIKDEMRHKEEQMAALGTSIITGQGRYVQSAETASITSQGEYATLADVSNALSDNFNTVLKVMADWEKQDPEKVNVEFNDDFETSSIDPAVLTALMGAVQAGYMSEDTYFYNLNKKEVYPDGWTMDDERKAIEKNKPKPETMDLNDTPIKTEQNPEVVNNETE